MCNDRPQKMNVSDECITRQEIKKALKKHEKWKSSWKGYNHNRAQREKGDIETTACVPGRSISHSVGDRGNPGGLEFWSDS